MCLHCSSLLRAIRAVAFCECGVSLNCNAYLTDTEFYATNLLKWDQIWVGDGKSRGVAKAIQTYLENAYGEGLRGGDGDRGAVSSFQVTFHRRDITLSFPSVLKDEMWM